MRKDENDESTSDEDSQTKYHIYQEDSTDTESIDSENSTFEVNDESIQPPLSEIISVEPIEAPQSVHFEDNITLRGDDDQPQPEPEEQLGHYGLLSYQQAISGEAKNKWKEAIEEENDDDGLLAGSDNGKMKKFLNLLQKEFEIKIDENPDTYLGITFSKSCGEVKLSQEGNAQVVDKYRMTDASCAIYT
ncbi:hypothetical protein JTB14_009015 [Gonioctena quinquepunctata]|nr:hypothetical protein JTB14_009015 [Gonioctena quinquepunctata]